MLTPKEARQVRKDLQDKMTVDKIVAKKDGTLEFYYGYFYRHGNTPEKWEKHVVKQLQNLGYEIEYSESEDRWASWPKDSWFVAHVAIKSLPDRKDGQK